MMRIFTQKLTAAIVVILGLVNLGVSVETPVRNVALNKPISAELTCGIPAEAFYGHRQINLPAENRVISTCDASNETLSFPPELMVDQDIASNLDNGYTWWQSASLNRIRNANSNKLDIANGLDTVITLDLTDLHYVQSVTIQMGDSVRPTQMSIQKSIDGQTWVNWSYKVTTIGQCQSRFQIQPSTAVTNTNGILCTTYTRAQLPRNEVITFDLIQSLELRLWQLTRYVRFLFFNMPQEFGLFANQFHHYTIRNIAVMAPCQCNDHASQCILMPSLTDITKMMYQCVCGGNTGGMTCNQCQPFYNQYPYEQGTNGFQCGECNCFQHSNECSYDINVGNVNASINANGALYGGGVCVGCQNNTAGINCNQCEMFNYRPAGKQQTDVDACQPCACHLPGTREDANIGLVKGECVPNNNEVLPPDLMPGDCYCKPNVQGQQCNECKNGYYDLTDANPNGCLSCNCYIAGTVNGSNTCNKTSNGQCPCKDNAFDRRCDQCQDGFYGLSADNPVGCTACSCDVGGAVTPACHKIDGQCTCRTNIQGRTCDRVAGMAYFGSLHTISSEFEYIGHENLESDETNYPNYRGDGYVTLSGSTSTTTTLIIPTSQLSGTFQLVLRAADDGPTQVDFTISPLGDTAGTTQQGAAVLNLCSTWCSQVVSFGNGDTGTLGPGEWSIVAMVNTQGGARVYLDYVVAIPVEFADPSGLLGTEKATQFIATCDVITNDMKLNTTEEPICLSAVFSLTNYYFNGAKQCNCDLTGSFDNNCDPYSGQCQCKPGVGGQRCDACLPEYYNFRSTGCTACECSGANKVCNPTTGQCECPPNTAGRRCDRCLTFAWGLNEVTGCQPCDCHQDGSISQQCDLVSGECDCHPGVGSQTCSECLDGYKVLSSTGCQPCGCSADGSLSEICNKTDGQCICKGNVGGVQCNDCAEGTFYNSATQRNGCLQCICMGITANCASSADRSIRYTIATNPASVNKWALVTVTPVQDTPSDATPTSTNLNGQAFVTVPVPVGAALYWVLPQVNGELLGVYGTMLTFSLFYELDTSAVGPAELEIRVYMEGMGNRFVRILGANSANTSTEFTISMIESEWRVDNPQFGEVTRGEFLRTLVNVEKILIAAQMNSAAHSSSIGGVSYFKATGPLSPSYNPAASLALTVENCNCGPGYVGSSCEKCDVGYHRSNAENHAYFGMCVQCECNGHSEQCDQTTGQCLNCQHNTQGFNCEQCGVGFYGNATVGTASDCTQCPCSPPKSKDTTCSLVNGLVTCTACASGHLDALCNRCDVFHFGQPELPNGFCTQCVCTGNSASCNPITGVCLNCQDGTIGDNCERCNEQTFGDASQQNCQACNCDATGSSSNLCDHVTGQCPCKPGVGDRICNDCQQNFYSFSVAGCTDCGCNQFGSINQQCSEAGVCPCLAGVTGAKCDQCEPGSFGLPLQACAICACNALGTIGGAGAVCNSVIGQCPCQPGVTGRQCDMCTLGFVDLTVNGCTKCDKCVETLLNSTFNLDDIWTGLWADASLLGQLQERDTELQRLEPEANRTIQQLTATINSYSNLRAEIQQINQQQYYTDVNNLLNRVTVHNSGTVGRGVSALNRTLELLEESGNQIDRIGMLQIEAKTIYGGAVVANQTILTIIDVVRQWVNTASDLYVSAEPRVQVILGKSFTAQQGLIEAELSRSQNVSSQADALHTSITNQALECNRLVAIVNTAEQDLTNTQEQINNLKQDLDEIGSTLGEIDSLLNDTQTLLSYSTTLIAEALDGLQTIGAVLGMASSNIFDGNQAFQDARTIRVGAQNGNTVPELVPNAFGINGWVHGEATARNTINTIEGNMATTAARVGEAESRAAQLEATAQQIQAIFGGVQANGQTAVQAIQMYQDTLTVYAEAVSTSQQATTTLAATQAYFAQRPVQTIQQEATASRQASVNLRQQVNARATDQAALDTLLTAANQTLIEAETLWLGLSNEKDALVEQGMGLDNLAKNPGIQPAIDQGTADSNTAISLSNQIISGSDQLDARLQTNQQEIGFIQETVANASTLNTVLPITVTNTETQLNALQGEVASLQQVQTETARLRTNITSKMTALREKLRLAQERIANTKQPVRFTGQSSITINRQGQDTTLFNELQVEFKADQRDGLLFFAENPNTNAFISLEIVTSHLMFKFNVRADVVAIESPIEVCCDGEWFRVLATRYEDEGQLSVVKLSTGGASVTHNSSINTYDRHLAFAPGGTPLFVGGLPANYRTTKALSTDFEGCIANVVFDNQQFDLWRPDALEGSTSCCEGPQITEGTQPEIIPGIGFTGFGYLEVKKQTFDIYNQAAVSFKFRTFLQDAVVFLVSRLDLISHIGVYVNNGKVVYEMKSSGNAKYTITSQQDYNDANWYKVAISFNESQHNMDIYNVSNAEDLLETFSRQTLAPLRFSNLQHSPKILLGAHISALPLAAGTIATQFVHGPNGLPFAGALNDLMLSNGSSWNLEPRVITNETAQQYKGVTFNGVMAQVAPGVGFKGAYAFAKLRVPNLLQLTRTITFSFKTFEPHGILAYSYDGQSFNKLFYVALYHGNLFLQYNIGEGQSEPLQTRGLRLNTGQWQTVSVDFSGLSASLKVNSLPTIYGNRVIPTNGIPIIATNSYLYVGGVPETTPMLIGGEYPVRQSLNSGILDLAINGVLINFNDPAIVVDQLGMDLSGITPEVTSLPPIPYPTEPPPDTTPPPMVCAAPIPVLYHQSQVVRLGTQPGGYMAYDLDQAMRNNFANGFVITMEFRTVAPDGILFYAADNAARPGQFMVLTMFEGKLSFSIMTSTRALTGLNINTEYRYDDGIWHEVVVLRINDFVAILVQERRDYDNNGIASNSVTSTLTLGTSFYVGGIANSINTNGLAVTNGFDGCIRKLDISFTDVAGLNFNFDASSSQQGVTQCIQNEIEPGASFNGTGSWIQLENNFQVSSNLEVRMMLRTTEQRSALLFAVSANAQNFFAADIHDGSVRVAISHQTGSSYIARSTQLNSLYDICNGRPHEIIIRFKSTQLELIVDGKMDTTPFSQTPLVNTNSPLYIGGVPNANSVSIGGLSTDSFFGCIKMLTINGVTRDLGSNVNSAEIITGCPLPHP